MKQPLLASYIVMPKSQKAVRETSHTVGGRPLLHEALMFPIVCFGNGSGIQNMVSFPHMIQSCNF